MSCHDYQLALMDIARGVPGADHDHRAALDHLERCGRCAAMLKNQQTLSRGLRALASSIDVPAGAALERRLLDGLPELARGAEPWWRAAFRVAAAVVLVAGALVGTWRDFTRVNRQSALQQSQFVPWPGAAALPPFESGELIRTELPTEVLPALGLQAPVPSIEKVPADVLVGQDGLVRAVRLVN
jgi:hypothetical protein